MSSSLARKRKRMALRKMSTKELTDKLNATQDHVIATALSMIIDMDYEDGKSYEELCARATRTVDKYETITDFDAYAAYVYNKTGVGIIRTED